MSTPDPRAEVELAAALAKAHPALAAADTDDAVLRAVALVVGTYGPSVIRMYTLHGGESSPTGLPRAAELSSVWQNGTCPAEDPLLGRRFAVADHPVLARWLAAPTRPLVLHDLAADPRPGAHVAERSAQALVVLPLHSEQPAVWLGVLVLSWPIVHIPGPRERLVYDLLSRTAAAFLAARRALREHQRALDEANTIYVATAALAEAGGLDEILAALAEPAQAAGAAWASLWIHEPGPAGPRLVRRAPESEGEPPARDAAALTDLFGWPNEPWLFEHAAEDRLDPGARAAGVQAAILLPLAWQGHRAGLLELGWADPRAFASELRRLYAALARHAAVVLSGRVLLAEAERAVAAASGDDLAGVLAGLSFGVVVGDIGVPLLHNPASERLLAGDRAGDGRLAAVLRDALAAGAPVRREIAVRGGDEAALALDLLSAPGSGEGGSALALDVLAAPIRDAAGAPVRVVAVLQDITDHRRAERERIAVRDELIRTQAAVLAQRATPTIPLSDSVVALPLVGPLDAARGRQLAGLAAGLGGAVQTVILDLTGVPTLDAEATDQLLAAVHALHLRGMKPVLSGVSAEDARDLAGRAELTVVRTLADALAAALFARSQ